MPGDLVVLDTNLLECPFEQITSVNVIATIVDGEFVFENNAFHHVIIRPKSINSHNSDLDPPRFQFNSVHHRIYGTTALSSLFQLPIEVTPVVRSRDPIKLEFLDPLTALPEMRNPMLPARSTNNFKPAWFRVQLIVAFICVVATANVTAQQADIVLQEGRIYTLVLDLPWASSIAVKGNKIIRVEQQGRIGERWIGEKTRVIELDGRFVMPGFIDAHTHFASFAAQEADINLLRVNDDTGLVKELERVVERLDPGEWITGGKWEGYKQWQAGWKNVEELNKNRWRPSRLTADKVSPENPILLSSYDGELYLANTLALKEAGLLNSVVDGMHLDTQDIPTGLINGDSPALEKIRSVVKPKSEQRLLNELRHAFGIMRRMGITEIHDMTSADVVERYVKLRDADELTARVWMRPHLVDAEAVIKSGARMGMHPITGKRDRFLRYGAFKAHFDGLMGSHGALLFEPYSDKPSTTGHYRCCTSTDRSLLKPNMRRFDLLLNYAVSNGFSINAHAIGTRGVAELLDAYERLQQSTGKPLQRFRVIHAQTIRPEDFERFRNLNLIAEVNPYMIEDDMRWMERRLGPERVKMAFPINTLLQNQILLTIGSDIPGAAGATFTNDPRYVLHTAVTRTRPDGTPQGGWLPSEIIPLDAALKAYTFNACYATFDEDVRGSVEVGKLADLVVIDKDPFKLDIDKLISMNVEMTIVDGKIVYEPENPE